MLKFAHEAIKHVFREEHRYLRRKQNNDDEKEAIPLSWAKFLLEILKPKFSNQNDKLAYR